MKAAPTVALGSLVTFASGGTPTRSVEKYFAGDIPWVTGADLSENNRISPRSFITDEAVKESAVTLVPQGTILLVTRTSVGKVAIADRSLGFSQDITALTPNREMIDGRYLRSFLVHYAPALATQARGATISGVTRSTVAEIQVPLPPVPEQRRIASILSEVADMRFNRASSISAFGDMVESAFLDMFAAEDVSTVPLQSLLRGGPASIRTGPFGSQLLHSEFVARGIPVLGIDNVVSNEFLAPTTRFITEEKYEQLARYSVNPGDVLITIMGTVGRCVVVPEGIGRVINTKHLCCITLDQSRCLPEYLRAYFLFHPVARRYLSSTSKGAIMDGLNIGLLRELPVVAPPMARQREFVAISHALRDVVARERTHLAKLDELFASLQYRAFRGEL